MDEVCPGEQKVKGQPKEGKNVHVDEKDTGGSLKLYYRSQRYAKSEGLFVVQVQQIRAMANVKQRQRTLCMQGLCRLKVSMILFIFLNGIVFIPKSVCHCVSHDLAGYDNEATTISYCNWALKCIRLFQHSYLRLVNIIWLCGPNKSHK